MRCRRCGTFAFPAWKPRMQYQYGRHCEGCRSAGTATARLQKQAKERRQRYLTLAVEAWQRWRADNGERAVWIAGEVNRQLGAGEDKDKAKLHYPQRLPDRPHGCRDDAYIHHRTLPWYRRSISPFVI